MARRKDSPQKLGKSFGKAEDNAFINGTGADELTGILHHTDGAKTALTVFRYIGG